MLKLYNNKYIFLSIALGATNIETILNVVDWIRRLQIVLPHYNLHPLHFLPNLLQNRIHLRTYPLLIKENRCHQYCHHHNRHF